MAPTAIAFSAIGRPKASLMRRKLALTLTSPEKPNSWTAVAEDSRRYSLLALVDLDTDAGRQRSRADTQHLPAEFVLLDFSLEIDREFGDRPCQSGIDRVGNGAQAGESFLVAY